MTRGEEIIIQSYDYGKYLLDTGFSTEEAALKCMRVAFIDGARWADSHPHWISVEDELPPKYDSYLTRSSGNVIEITHYNIDGWHTESKGKVTHWMPLPSIEGIKGNQGETSPNEEGGEE